jgi:hypothetical protein
MLDETISFVSDDELRQAVPAGTVALAQIRPNKDGELVIRDGVSEFGPWLGCNFEVIEGEHKGEWASLMLTVKPTDRKFRAVFVAVTGEDISGGKDVSFNDFKNQMLSGVFEVELGPEKKRGELTGYTSVLKVVRRVRDRDGAATATTATAAAPTIESAPVSAVADDDIPF